jgi:hypothetical protein
MVKGMKPLDPPDPLVGETDIHDDPAGVVTLAPTLNDVGDHVCTSSVCEGRTVLPVAKLKVTESWLTVIWAWRQGRAHQKTQAIRTDEESDPDNRRPTYLTYE